VLTDPVEIQKAMIREMESMPPEALEQLAKTFGFL
jgi:hypothetical protein